MSTQFTGDYVNAFISDESSSQDSIERVFFEKTIDKKPGEAVYVFSFKENKLQYASGFEEIFGIKDSEVNLLMLNKLYTDDFVEFTNEYHDRILLFAYNNNNNLETFSSKEIIKIKGFDLALTLHIEILKTDENGNLVSIIGRINPNENIQISEIVQYAFEGDFDLDVLYKINHRLNYKNCVSHKMIKIIDGINKGKNSKQIARTVGYKVNIVEELIEAFKAKFNLKSESELIQFAKEKHLVPDQFRLYF